MTTKKKNPSLTIEQENALRKLEREAVGVDSNGENAGYCSDEPESQLGKRLEYQRRAKGLTQGQLADLTKQADQAKRGLSRGVISLYELGINRPGVKEIRLLCEVLRISPSYLIYGDEHPFEETARLTHFDGIADTEPEYFSRMLYCLWRLDPFYTLPIMQMVMRTLGDDIKGLMEFHADRVFLDMADQLRITLNEKEVKLKPTDKSKTKKKT